MHENDEIAADPDERVRAGHGGEFIAGLKKIAAVYFTVEEIYDQTPEPGSAGKKDGPKIGCTAFILFLQKIPGCLSIPRVVHTGQSRSSAHGKKMKYSG